MEKWDKYYLEKQSINIEVFKKGIEIQEKLGRLDILIRNTFPNYKMASRIFAFIESKYSSKIEGIYTTLFENINTGINKEKENLIRPLVDALFKEKEIINEKDILQMEKELNKNINRDKRWAKEFGIYKDEKTKIYEPSLNKKEVNLSLKELFKNIKNTNNLIEIIQNHIIFEKIHPFVDANGRIGRLILQKQIINKLSFVKIIPLSWSIYKNNALYYEALDNAKTNINDSIIIFLNIIEDMIKTLKAFIKDIENFYEKNKEKVLSYSNKINEEIAKNILFSIQTKRFFLEKHYSWNPRTIDKIFNHLIEQDLDFNIKIVSKQKLYWNIELETIINAHFNK